MRQDTSRSHRSATSPCPRGGAHARKRSSVYQGPSLCVSVRKLEKTSVPYSMGTWMLKLSPQSRRSDPDAEAVTSVTKVWPPACDAHASSQCVGFSHLSF